MDAHALINSLDADRIAERIQAIDAERKALMVLLRAARSRGLNRAKTGRSELRSSDGKEARQ